MRLFGLGAVATGCALVLVLSSSASAAIYGPGAHPEACPVRHVLLNVSYECAAEFSLRGSNGYRITVSADPPGSGHGDIQLTAESRAGSVLYIAPESLTPDGVIKASFGPLGKLALRFRPSGKVRRVKVPKKCLRERPPVVTAQLGVFVGSFRFRGENDYTTASSHRLAGGVGDPIAISGKKPNCEAHPSAAQQKQEENSIGLEASDRGANLSLDVARASGSLAGFAGSDPATSGTDDYLFLVIAGERAEGMRILRFVAAGGPPSDFAFDNALTSATVSPPSPFTGSGSFLRSPAGSTSWTGSLGVSIPGIGNVSLTTTVFKAELATQAVLLKRAEEEAESR
jgi:hypothetical protein